MKRLIVEFIAPFALIFLGFGAAATATVTPTINGGDTGSGAWIGLALVGLAFWLGARGKHIRG